MGIGFVQDFLGFAECTLGQIVSAGYDGLSVPLTQNRSKYYPMLPKLKKESKGFIILVAEELTQLKEEVKNFFFPFHIFPSFLPCTGMFACVYSACDLLHSIVYGYKF